MDLVEGKKCFISQLKSWRNEAYRVKSIPSSTVDGMIRQDMASTDYSILESMIEDFEPLAPFEVQGRAQSLVTSYFVNHHSFADFHEYESQTTLGNKRRSFEIKFIQLAIKHLGAEYKGL